MAGHVADWQRAVTQKFQRKRYVRAQVDPETERALGSSLQVAWDLGRGTATPSSRFQADSAPL